jgi:hypothetical protein
VVAIIGGGSCDRVPTRCPEHLSAAQSLPILTGVSSPSPTPTRIPATQPASTILHAVWKGIWATATSSPWIAIVLALFLLMAMVRLVHAIAHPSDQRDPMRRFSRQDKRILLARAGGRCERHGWLTGRCQQTEKLEADHIHPHSRGGQTAIVNGQVLCRNHNRTKRASIPFNWQLRTIERHRIDYYPAGVPGSVVRRAARTTVKASRHGTID